MITTGSKYFLGLAAAAFIAAGVYGWGTDGGLIGVVLLGLKGGVGEQAGYTVLAFVCFGALLLGGVSTAFRDADPDAVQAIAPSAALPEATPPAGLSPWPVVGAFGAAVTVLGLVISPVLFVAGLIVTGVVAVEWLVQTWADRATGDPETNQQIRNRLMYPLEIPAVGALAIAGLVVAVSRVLLALPKAGSNIVAIAVAALILAVASLVAFKPRLSKNVIVGFLVLVALGVLAGGVTAAALGERDFEPHTEEHGQQSGGDEGGLGSIQSGLEGLRQ
ncbi:MAG: hypothetical protein ACRD0U_00475 [Acidimicrobiales bacterium]